MKKQLIALIVIFSFLISPVSADKEEPYLEISKGTTDGHIHVHKFGHNEDLDTSLETIWSGSSIYTYPAAATFMNLTSTDVDDVPLDTGAWNVTIFGLDANYNQINETLQLNGQTRVQTTNQYLRVFRAFIRETGTTLSNEGIIYLGTGATVAGVPANIYLMIDQNYGQTMMTQYTIPDGYTGYMSHFVVTCFTANKNFEVYLRTRWFGEGWRRIEEAHLVSGQSVYIPYDPPRVIPERTDIEFIGEVGIAGGVTEISYCLILVEDGSEDINQIFPVEIVESVDLMSTEFFAFIILAFTTMYLAWSMDENRKAALGYAFSTLFWIATMYQWAVDQVGTQSFYLIWLYIAPLSFCIIQFLNMNFGSYDDVEANMRKRKSRR